MTHYVIKGIVKIKATLQSNSSDLSVQIKPSQGYFIEHGKQKYGLFFPAPSNPPSTPPNPLNILAVSIIDDFVSTILTIPQSRAAAYPILASAAAQGTLVSLVIDDTTTPWSLVSAECPA